MSLQEFPSRRSLPSSLGKCVGLAAILPALLLCTGGPVRAAIADDAVEDSKPKERKEVALTTEDGLHLNMVYYAGTKGRDSIPVILIHGYKGSSKDFTEGENPLAPLLQEKLGCAVLVPDLRGHGQSLKLTTKNKLGAVKEETLKPEKLMPKQFVAMVQQDLRAVKNYLWSKNNRGELNLDKLCVVGLDMGAGLALEFTLMDADDYEQAESGRMAPQYKAGRFVKAAVLISPDLAAHGMNARNVINSPLIRNELPTLILVGKDNPARVTEAKRIFNVMSHGRPATEDSTVLYGALNTSVQGAKLLSETSLGVPLKIGRFFYARLVKNAEAKTYIWRERKDAHGS